MTRLILVTIGVLLAASVPASAGIVEGAELEHARANARAGGPVSERDAELLERWGCTSGTQNPVCGQGYSGHRHYRHRTHRRHRR
jgi:hypothetical protein